MNAIGVGAIFGGNYAKTRHREVFTSIDAYMKRFGIYRTDPSKCSICDRVESYGLHQIKWKKKN